jgi:hypothetical protein
MKKNMTTTQTFVVVVDSFYGRVLGPTISQATARNLQNKSTKAHIKLEVSEPRPSETHYELSVHCEAGPHDRMSFVYR